MELKKGFEIRKVAGENVVVATGVENVDFSKIIAMNSTAAYLWEECKKVDSFTIKELCEMLMKNYEVSEELALKDAHRIAQEWVEVGIAKK